MLEEHNISPRELEMPKKKPSVGRLPKRKKTVNVNSIDRLEEVDLQEEM